MTAVAKVFYKALANLACGPDDENSGHQIFLCW
ncbi:hypothetical protein KPSA1_03909 [Pseudomonas syringae pv. actinidiae]|uniref:Uncharacterized protein n=1 Tax=Pseudomonas syringae pv. actinidiae TaxID=103796 RepID=A0A2V0QC53_PSESF|nr:hypothetical protein KPSA1_03909 [Pseudomonas syringae pv. actinidiae]